MAQDIGDRDTMNGILQVVDEDLGFHIKEPALDWQERQIKDWVRTAGTMPANAQSPSSGKTCLHLAAQYSFPATVKYLLNKGADPSLKDKKDETAWDLALEEITSTDDDWIKLQAAIKVMDLFLDRERMGIGRGHLYHAKIRQSSSKVISDWYQLRSQDIIELFYVVRVAVGLQNPGRRQQIICHVMKYFRERHIPGSLLSFREPYFASSRLKLPSSLQEVMWSLTMPYFTLDSMEIIQNRVQELDNHVKNRKYCCAGSKRAGGNLHVPITIDEFCKPALGQRLENRNNDQILTNPILSSDCQETESAGQHGSRGASGEANDQEAHVQESHRNNLITIRQSWLWILNDVVIMAWGQPNAYTDTYKSVGVPMIVGKFLSDLIGLPASFGSASLSGDFLDQYQKFIYLLSDQVNEYLKLLQNTKTRSLTPFEFSDFDIDQEAKFFHQASDVREELSMIRSVISSQEEIWKSFMLVFFPKDCKDGRFENPATQDWISGVDRFQKQEARKRQREADRSDTFSTFMEGPVEWNTDEETDDVKETRKTRKTRKKRHSIDLFSSDTGTSEETDDVKKETDDVKKETDDVKKETDDVKKKTDDVKEETDYVKKETDDVKEETDDVKIQKSLALYEEVWNDIARPQDQFERYKRRLAQLDEDAARVEASIATALDLRAKHKSMQEAHSTAVMSAAVFGFTIVTVVFTPLSFVVSLFALPIERFKDHQDEATGAYSTNYIGKWAATTEVVTLITTLIASWLAVEFGLRRSVKNPWGRRKREKPKGYEGQGKENKRPIHRRSCRRQPVPADPDVERGTGEEAA